MKPPDFMLRIMGQETEYALQCLADSKTTVERLITLLRKTGNLHSRRVASMWLPNGGCIYEDVGLHPEHATAECLSGHEVALHDRAGEQELLRRLEVVQQRYGVKVALCKNNVDYHDSRWGTHENYLLPRRLSIESVFSHLAAYLVSRQLWAGAGHVVPMPKGWHYLTSQRGALVKAEMSLNTTLEMAIVNTRDEPHANRAKYQRLHLTVADSNMMFLPCQLRFDATSLLLHMLEHNQLRPLHLNAPVSASVSFAYNWQRAVPASRRRRLNALDIQRHYFEQAVRFVDTQGLEAYSDTIMEWGFILDAFAAGREELLVGRVDHVTKKDLIDRYALKHGAELSLDAARGLSLRYHVVGDQLSRALRQLHDPASLAAEIEVAKVTPPSTRAQARTALIARALEGAQVAWDEVMWRDEEGKEIKAIMSNPYCTTHWMLDDTFAVA